jgi:membrane-associated phospholipid phosphatase
VTWEPAPGSRTTLEEQRRPRWAIVIAAWIAAFLVAVVIAFALQSSGDWGRGLPWEIELLRNFDFRLPRALDIVMLIVPWFGTNITLIPISFGAAGYLYWRRHRADLALHLIVMQLGVFSLNQLVKAIFDRPRPALWELRGQFAQAAYPSGHLLASIAVLFTYAVLLRRERGWRWPFALAVLILIVSTYSRLYLGVHWPTDVIAGALMGIIWLAGTLVAFQRRG